MVTLQLVMRILDFVFGAVGIILIARLLLRLFQVKSTSPAMQIVTAITDPIQQLVRKVLGISSYSSGYATYPRIAPDVVDTLVALVALWATRTLVMWLLQLGMLVPIWIAAPLRSIRGILIQLLNLLFELYGLALFVRILFEWVHVPYHSRVMRWLWKLTEPVLAPIRRILPPFAGLDFSPLVAFLLLRVLQRVLLTLISWL